MCQCVNHKYPTNVNKKEIDLASSVKRSEILSVCSLRASSRARGLGFESYSVCGHIPWYVLYL